METKREKEREREIERERKRETERERKKRRGGIERERCQPFCHIRMASL